jgi:sugar O-acyltransferase (sialic acid O-acetyltransferase NeuD family)
MFQIRVGIGDILLQKIAEINDLISLENIEINDELIVMYRENNNDYRLFIKKLVDILYKNSNITYSKNSNLPLIDITSLEWNKAINFSLNSYLFNYISEPFLKVNNYIVFTTKIRSSDKSLFNILSEFKTFCETSKFNVPIVIIGERKLLDNYEVLVHPFRCIYDILILLKKNNNVIDLTEETLNNNPNFDSFIRDINIISYASEVISIGYGGNFCMNMFFGKQIKSYIGNINYKWSIFNNHSSLKLYKNSNEFMNMLNELTQKKNNQNNNKEVWLVQTGGHSKQCIDIFLDNGYTIKGCFDNWCKGKFYRDTEIVDSIDNMFKYVNNNDPIFCTIGDNKKRKECVEKYPFYNWINCISKYSYISPSVILGIGNYIGNTTKILADSKVGNFNIINDGATMTHDNEIEDFNHLAPNCSLGGKVRIANNCLIGTNATVNPNISINNNNIVGSGGVLVKSIEKESIIVKGIPAK